MARRAAALAVGLQKKIGNGREVGSSLVLKPVERADIFLKGFVELFAIGRGYVLMWYSIDWKATVIWG